MKLTKKQLIDIKEHSLKCFPNEMCGIISNKIFIPITNIHEKAENNFLMNPIELMPYAGKISAIVHSHTRDPKTKGSLDIRTPSWNDILGQQKSKVPWIIVGTEGIGITDYLTIPRIKNNKYTDRPFIWFMNDCYSIVQDYYWFEFKINLPNHKAEEDFANIRRRDNLFDNYIQQFGFKELPTDVELQKGDILLLDFAGFTRNHLGIYQGDKTVLHQDIISRIEPIENFQDRFHKVLRYVN